RVRAPRPEARSASCSSTTRSPCARKRSWELPQVTAVAGSPAARLTRICVRPSASTRTADATRRAPAPVSVDTLAPAGYQVAPPSTDRRIDEMPSDPASVEPTRRRPIDTRSLNSTDVKVLLTVHVVPSEERRVYVLPP